MSYAVNLVMLCKNKEALTLVATHESWKEVKHELLASENQFVNCLATLTISSAIPKEKEATVLASPPSTSTQKFFLGKGGVEVFETASSIAIMLPTLSLASLLVELESTSMIGAKSNPGAAITLGSRLPSSTRLSKTRNCIVRAAATESEHFKKSIERVVTNSARTELTRPLISLIIVEEGQEEDAA